MDTTSGQSDEANRIARYLGHLPDREGQVLRMRFIEAMDFADIADSLSISVSTVKTHC